MLKMMTAATSDTSLALAEILLKSDTVSNVHLPTSFRPRCYPTVLVRISKVPQGPQVDTLQVALLKLTY